MEVTSRTDRLLSALSELRSDLEGAEIVLEVRGAGPARSQRDELVGQMDDYLLPRLRDVEAPLLAVIGGSTGSGKSTLLNTIVGRSVSPAGVLRPTTRSPVLVSHPHDQSWFLDERVLPGLRRTTGAASGDPGTLHLVCDDDVGPGIALLDAPDIDSVAEANRVLAAELLAAADLWIFLTTAARYADAVPWGFLEMAQARSTSLCIVLNRVEPQAADEVHGDLRRMLEEHGLEAVEVFTLLESPLDNGALPAAQSERIRSWLGELTRDAEGRAAIVRQTLNGALDSLGSRVEPIAQVLDEQIAAFEAMREQVDAAYRTAQREIDDALLHRSLLRGEVLARWQEYVGTGDFMRSLETGIGRLRETLRSFFVGEPTPAGDVRVALAESVATITVSACERAAEATADAWRAGPGTALVEARPQPSSSGLREAVGDEVRAWQRSVLDMVAAEGASKRATGRVLSLGVNATGSALMVAMFAHTGGLTGGELAIAGGTAALSQKVLEAVFGDQAVRELTERARADLMERLRGLVEAERARSLAALDDAARGARPGDALRGSLAAVQAARAQ